MKIFDFTQFEDEIYPTWEKQFKIDDSIGGFSYHPKGKVDSYGTTDTIISRYIINQLSLSSSEKGEWGEIINQFQDPNTGWYTKKYTLHYKEHTTAFAIAALHLINQRPKHPLKWKSDIIISKEALIKWFNQRGRPIWSEIWSGSHVISGVPAALAMTKEAPDAFFDWYFEWLNHEVDPNTGFWRRGWIHKYCFRKPHFHDMAGAFHMYYIYEWFNRHWLYPEHIIDYTLKFQQNNGLWHIKGAPYCLDLDGLYSLARSSRIANGYRAEDIKNAFIRFLEATEPVFNNQTIFFQEYPNTHRLTGALSAIAECQKFYPELIRTRRPWKQSLDSACFI